MCDCQSDRQHHCLFSLFTGSNDNDFSLCFSHDIYRSTTRDRDLIGLFTRPAAKNAPSTEFQWPFPSTHRNHITYCIFLSFLSGSCCRMRMCDSIQMEQFQLSPSILWCGTQNVRPDVWKTTHWFCQILRYWWVHTKIKKRERNWNQKGSA